MRRFSSRSFDTSDPGREPDREPGRKRGASFVASLCAWPLSALFVLSLPACGSSGDGGDAGTSDAMTGDDGPVLQPDGAAICAEFTEAGAPCPGVNPVRCFAMCATGGCSCRATPQGPRWSCTTDTSCQPDCAPIDDGC
jgi:hypothetical protein